MQRNTSGREAGPTAPALPLPRTAAHAPYVSDPHIAAARLEMVARLEEAGDLQSGPVRDALLALPRETLMPQAYVRRSAPDDREELLGLLHSGDSVAIQHEGEPILDRASGARA